MTQGRRSLIQLPLDPPQNINWLIPAASIFAALVVGLANFLAQRWRYRLDRTAASVEHLCGEINSAADLATRYWLIIPDATNLGEINALEAQIVGRQLRIQALFLAFRQQDHRLDLLVIMREMGADFYDALSGGNFQVRSRAQDLVRARLVQSRAAEMNGAIRAALAHRSRRLF